MSTKNIISIFIIPAAVLTAIICFFYMTDNKVNSSNISYINSCGWQVDNKCSDISYFTIPEEFDSVFSAYNNLVIDGGYDLTPYKGMRAARYSYIVTNHPESNTRLVRINILICKNNIISADISVLGKNGSIEPIYISQ